jgi:Zinc finger, C2H2 type
MSLLLLHTRATQQSQCNNSTKRSELKKPLAPLLHFADQMMAACAAAGLPELINNSLIINEGPLQAAAAAARPDSESESGGEDHSGDEDYELSDGNESMPDAGEAAVGQADGSQVTGKRKGPARADSAKRQKRSGSSSSEPHVCAYCAKTFGKLSKLTRHMRTHTGECPYVCDEPGCGKAYPRRDHLDRHMKSHSEGGM